jgi:hypothetical protein
MCLFAKVKKARAGQVIKVVPWRLSMRSYAPIPCIEFIRITNMNCGLDWRQVQGFKRLRNGWSRDRPPYKRRATWHEQTNNNLTLYLSFRSNDVPYTAHSFIFSSLNLLSSTMKYHTLLVPVAVLAALAVALPSEPNRHSSDQGSYRPRPKESKADNHPSLTSFASGLTPSQLRRLEVLPMEGASMLSPDRLGFILSFPEGELKNLSLDQLRAIATIPANVLSRLSFLQVLKITTLPIELLSKIGLENISTLLETPSDILESLSVDELLRLLHLPVDGPFGRFRRADSGMSLCFHPFTDLSLTSPLVEGPITNEQ